MYQPSELLNEFLSLSNADSYLAVKLLPVLEVTGGRPALPGGLVAAVLAVDGAVALPRGGDAAGGVALELVGAAGDVGAGRLHVLVAVVAAVVVAVAAESFNFFYLVTLMILRRMLERLKFR